MNKIQTESKEIDFLKKIPYKNLWLFYFNSMFVSIKIYPKQILFS